MSILLAKHVKGFLSLCAHTPLRYTNKHFYKYFSVKKCQLFYFNNCKRFLFDDPRLTTVHLCWFMYERLCTQDSRLVTVGNNGNTQEPKILFVMALKAEVSHRWHMDHLRPLNRYFVGVTREFCMHYSFTVLCAEPMNQPIRWGIKLLWGLCPVLKLGNV